MANALRTSVIAFAFGAVLASTPGFSETDLTGTWHANYTAVSPTNSRGEGPRFNQAEWQLTITDQQGNAFYGETKWRSSNSQEWTALQVTGSISVDGMGRIGLVEISTEAPYEVHSVIDGQLDGDQIYVDYRSLHTGTAYSAVLKKTSEGN